MIKSQAEKVISFQIFLSVTKKWGKKQSEAQSLPTLATRTEQCLVFILFILKQIILQVFVHLCW